MGDDNPFLALFESGPGSKANHEPSQVSLKADVIKLEPSIKQINDFYERIFSFTLNKDEKERLERKFDVIYIENTSNSLKHNLSCLTIDTIGQAICERIFYDEEDLVRLYLPTTAKSNHNDRNTEETRRVLYLTECYKRCYTFKVTGLYQGFKKSPSSYIDDNIVNEAIQRIIENLVTILRAPEIMGGDGDAQEQLFGFFNDANNSPSVVGNLLEDIVTSLEQEGERSLADQVSHHILNMIKEEVQNDTLIGMGNVGYSRMEIFVDHPSIARQFMLYNYPKDVSKSTGYSQTLLGIILSKSCLPMNEMGAFDFFENPSSQPAAVHNRTEGQIWQALEQLQTWVFKIFKKLMHISPDAKHLALMWIGECLKANAGRGKLWTSEMGAIMSANFVSDGFMLNLSGVLLQFCLPFTTGAKNSKLFKIDARYSACAQVEVSEDSRLKNVHLRDASKETCLVESVDPDERICDVDTFNFITDIFFITHKSMDLGLRVCHEKLVKINQELGRQQEVYREMIQQNVNEAQREAVQKRTDNLMTRYLSLKAALLLPQSMSNMMKVISSTGFWLTNLAISYGDKRFLAEGKTDIFPLIENKVALELKYVPEHLVENICEYLLLVKRFQPALFEQHGEYLEMIMDFVLPFMGSPHWLKNPHLRARLAECLECLLPHHELQGSSGFSLKFNRERIFTEYKFRLEIIPCILNVFVNIENTGQAVEFEMKFNYRRPMFEILKYVWEMEDYRAKMIQLANHAAEHILDEIPPLFLRFVNLLVNDAIFLLDEALSYMKQIQEEQAQKPQWDELPPNERTNRQSQYMHIGRLARYHNIMGLDNIKMLDMLTKEITAVFTHSTMVDRIAAMLNYFLKNLVGPERKSFKVQNLEEFAFRPAEVVKHICKIYTHYSECHSFLQAISSDGRSYSTELFNQAKSVLDNHIRDMELSESLKNVSTKVEKLATATLKDDELFADAPDEFLDAIMSHIMRDPVRLPSSGQIVDRPTIARHILSDQNDPFNRSPLTLDMVIPETELKKRIDNWMAAKRQE